MRITISKRSATTANESYYYVCDTFTNVKDYSFEKGLLIMFFNDTSTKKVMRFSDQVEYRIEISEEE